MANVQSDEHSEGKPKKAQGGHGEETHGGHGGGHGHGHAEFPFLQHHFDTPEHQFESGKLGIWAFLVTEVLFFAGLFCAYTVYRAQHSEVYVWAHYYLDTNLGALNTVVLLFSSLTAAWAVRCAQLKQQKGLVINIVLTIACACTFMVVKYFEYTHKFHDGLVWGGRGDKPAFGMKFNPKHEVWELPRFQKKHPEAAKLAEKLRREGPASAVSPGAPTQQASSAAPPPPQVAAVPKPASQAAAPALPAGAPGTPTTAATEKRSLPQEAWPLYQSGIINERGELLRYPNRGHVFFGVYFFMTGLHGFHVLAGIVVWVWLLLKAMRGVFGPMYFGPIDYAALYWHLVDLIWIYLFPLLYLIA